MNDVFERRREHTDRVLADLADRLHATIGDRFGEVIGNHTCVYATGSCGRGEMSESSDLDAYVVRRGDHAEADPGVLQLAILQANTDANLPPLDAGGRHTKTIAASTLIDRLGSPADDSSVDGAFTKRMLLLLESRVMIGEAAYDLVVDDVIDAYWQVSESHRLGYQPFVLVNDIVRWWRIVLLNHESRLRKREQELAEDPARSQLLLAERRYRSYKMRLARCLTCFSALTYLLALTPDEGSHVSRSHVRQMVRLSPLERISKLGVLAGEHELVPQILSTYARFLERAATGKEALLTDLRMDRDVARQTSAEGGLFTELMFKLVQKLGGGRRLHRHMLV